MCLNLTDELLLCERPPIRKHPLCWRGVLDGFMHQNYYFFGSCFEINNKEKVCNVAFENAVICPYNSEYESKKLPCMNFSIITLNYLWLLIPVMKSQLNFQHHYSSLQCQVILQKSF